MKQIEFWFDYTSPYTYLAAERLLTEPQFKAVDIVWRPFFLGGLFKLTGNRPPAEVAPKGPYMFRDLLRLARHFNIPYRFPPNFPVLTLLALRGATALEKSGHPRRLDYHAAVFRAYWRDERDISDEAIWREIVGEIGIDADALMAEATSEPVKTALKEATEEAANRGLFGAPSFFVDNEMYWGMDRLFLIEKALGVEA
jgi:2-hydroxychromene-2-carboxylate isomerase